MMLMFKFGDFFVSRDAFSQLHTKVFFLDGLEDVFKEFFF